ncbi:MAG: arylsulfatase [Planctomycetes bacterium]|nr:arylsulfatase [Planctomycetota bacterium]
MVSLRPSPPLWGREFVPQLLQKIATQGVWAASLLLAFCLNSTARTADPARALNIVIILADDQGWGDLSLNGNTNLRTPNIDSLARDGAKFDRFFVQPVCSPTRAEFLTGRWHPRGAVRGVSTGAERLDLDERTVADAFKAAGYATGCFGKWHNGSQYPYHPNGRGFTEYYGFTSGHWGEYYDPPLDHNGRAVRGKGYITDDLTDRAIAFLKANAAAGKPSFCYLAFNTPHSPMQVPDAYWQRFEKAALKLTGDKKEDVSHTRAALAMCENIDDNVGRLLAAIKEQKLEENTIVLYFSDNGPNGRRWNGGMKGIKGSTDEGGVRSPFLVRWPAKIRPGTVVAPIAGAVDLYPTLIDLCGIKRVGDKPFDGMSVAPWLLGAEPKPVDRVLFSHWTGRTSARDQRYRLDAAGQLFDLLADPDQTKNVAGDRPEDAKRLSAAVERWKRDVLGELPKVDDRPFPVGFAEFPRTVLPARDGVPHGGVKRSANAPNCSYFTNWTQPDDRMTWEVEVHASGRYEAIVHYTCPKGDVGSALELSLGAAKWAGTIAEAHDPPLRGKERDRVPRTGESFVKDFRALSLGVVELPAGKGTLTLRAAKVPGTQVADVRQIELVLTEGKK